MKLVKMKQKYYEKYRVYSINEYGTILDEYFTNDYDNALDYAYRLYKVYNHAYVDKVTMYRFEPENEG